MPARIGIVFGALISLSLSLAIPAFAQATTLTPSTECSQSNLAPDCFATWLDELLGKMQTITTDFNTDQRLSLADFEIWRRATLAPIATIIPSPLSSLTPTVPSSSPSTSSPSMSPPISSPTTVISSISPTLVVPSLSPPISSPTTVISTISPTLVVPSLSPPISTATASITPSLSPPALSPPLSSPTTAIPSITIPPVTIIAFGNIRCASSHRCLSSAIAQQLDLASPSAILMLGDLTNRSSHTRPAFLQPLFAAPGSNLASASARLPNTGYYSFDLGMWHIIALNSNCSRSTCASTSAQLTWLKQDLQRHQTPCTLAFMRNARFTSSGPPANSLKTLWKTLYDGHVDILLTGHGGNYERFIPLNSDGYPDPTQGIKQFVLGNLTMAHSDDERKRVRQSELMDSEGNGGLQLDLNATGYEWTYRRLGNKSTWDHGNGQCH